MKNLKIKVILGTPRTPRTQGLVEQGNSVLKERLSKWKIETGRLDWSNGLAYVSLSINNTKHSSTKFTPFELVFGRKAEIKFIENSDDLIEENENGEIYDFNEEDSKNDRFNLDLGNEFNQNNLQAEKNFVIAKKNSDYARKKMELKYNKSGKVNSYYVGQHISLKVPREDRAPTDEKRVFCVILEIPHEDSYKLCTSYGPLKRLYGGKDIEDISQNIDIGFDVEKAKVLKETNLHNVAKLNSSALFMSIRCSCKVNCSGRCKCLKNKVGCSVYCHGDANFICDNDKGIQTRTEISLKRKKD